ncbi:MAG: lysophospholipid acyltransferase family protein, partial [Anaerolineales bacterium]
MYNRTIKTQKNIIMRNILRIILKILFRLLTRIEVSGLENLPKSGGCILATNHLSRLDPPLLFVLIDRPDLTALAADKYQRYPFFREVINAVNGIWIHREDADFHALKAARDYLIQGGMLGIAPEGTRSKTGGLLPGKAGVAYLADKAAVPVVPVAIYGTEGAVPKMFLLKRPKLVVQFGKPLRFPPIPRQERERALQQNTDEIMC